MTDPLDVLRPLIHMAHDDPIQLLVLLLALPTEEGTQVTNLALSKTLGDVGGRMRLKYTPQAVGQRRRALAAEFPTLKDQLTPGSGRGNHG